MFERIVLLALLLLSIGYFTHVFIRRLRPIAAARTPLPRDRIPQRLWRTFSEVMLQSRVIVDRPVTGLLHALVMWGFFAFAWVSLEHLAVGFQGFDHARPDASHLGTSWYGSFAALWAAAVLVGIVGLSIRRFVMRPPTLGELSWSSALVAALIIVLMATYLLGWRTHPVAAVAWKINWWLHTLSLLGMLVVIPNSKHLHLVLGPVAVFFRSETTSAMRALREDDDDDFGLLTFADLSAKDILDVNACVECGRCTDVCPANVVGLTLDPKEVILQTQRGLLAGAETPAGTAAEVEQGEAWVRETDLFQCLSCGACEQACPVGIEHVGAKILDMRRGLVSEGRTHSAKLTQLFTTMERAPHNPWGVPHETRRKFVEAEDFPIFDGSQEWLFWLGCGNGYDPHGQDVARAMKKVLDAAGVSWGVLARETCCGEPARRAGNEYLYLEFIRTVDGVVSREEGHQGCELLSALHAHARRGLPPTRLLPETGHRGRASHGVARSTSAFAVAATGGREADVPRPLLPGARARCDPPAPEHPRSPAAPTSTRWSRIASAPSVAARAARSSSSPTTRPPMTRPPRPAAA